MKICNTEAIKIIKNLEEQKNQVVCRENVDCMVSYKVGEDKICGDYNYDKTRNAIDEIDSEIRSIRSALAKANCSVVVDDFDITIGEALILLAQLQSEKRQILSLSCKKQITRRITQNGVTEFTECLFSVEQAKEEVKELTEKISKLQIAIDRANLNNFIEI